MPKRHDAAFLLALVRSNLKGSFALRGAFWASLGFMALNNVLFFSVWWIFFARFEEVRGWRLPDIAALYGLVAASFGITVVVFGGVRDLARTIHAAELDAILVQPKSPLLQALASNSSAAGWGDILSGFGLLVYSGLVAPHEIAVLAVALLLGTSMFLATGVLIHSGAFWLGRIDSLARPMWEMMLTFSLYPSAIFQGGFKWLLFTVIPAGFIGHLPVSLLREFDWRTLGLAALGTAGWLTLAAWVFERGLRRYESGSRFLTRG